MDKICVRCVEAFVVHLTEESKVCQELVKFGCKAERGCKGRCKCLKAGMSCTGLCKCGGECERED